MPFLLADLIVEESRAGKTVFFSSHILSDVEMLCDRVCILRKGEVVAAGTVRELVGSEARRSEITIVDPPEDLAEALAKIAESTQRVGKTLVLDVTGDDKQRDVLACALEAGVHVDSVAPKRETLEDIFVRKAL